MQALNETGWAYALGEGWGKTVAVAVVTALASLWVGMRQGRASIIAAVQTAAHQMIADLREDVRLTRLELAEVRAECARIGDARKADNEDCDRKLAAMKLEIDTLMAGPVATYALQSVPYGWGSPSAPSTPLLTPEEIPLPLNGWRNNVPWIIAVICGVGLILALMLSGCEATKPYGPGAALPHTHAQDAAQCRDDPTSVFCGSLP